MPKLASQKKPSKSLSKPQKKAVSKIVNKKLSERLEKKYHLAQEGAENVTDDGTIFGLSTVTQGDSDITRDGDSLYIRSTRIQGYIENAGGAPSHNRLILFQWHDDSTPTPSNLFPVGYLGSIYAPVSPYHHDQRRKYTVLWDKKVRLDTTSNTSAFFDSGYKMPKVKKIAYTAGTTIGSNKLWLLAVNDIGSATYPKITFANRMTFNDA